MKGTTFRIRARKPAGAAAPHVEREPAIVDGFIRDAAHFPGGHADGVARPLSEAGVAALLVSHAPLLIAGAQSSLTGGATPHGGIVISTAKLTGIERMDAGHVRAGAGVPLLALQESIDAWGAWFPPVPTFMGAFAGGVVATNAAGAATFKYGTTRAWVEGLTCVMTCGCVLDVERGATNADPHFEIACAHGTRTVVPGTYRMPDVPKVSAGYFAAPGMDLVDLFVGSEGTLAVITSVTFRVLPVKPRQALALLTSADEEDALRLVAGLRALPMVAAIEHLDRRCLEIVREDGEDVKNGVVIPSDTAMLLIVQIELPAAMTDDEGLDQIAGALDEDAADSELARFTRLLDRHGALERTEIAMPGNERRKKQMLAVREAAPTGVNRRVGDAKRADQRISKTAADMIVPFGRFAEMMAIYERGYRARGLDYAIWGHVSDGNVHPNVIPRSYEDVEAGKDAIFEFGREAARLGGCPLAEHGVGRHPVKQELLRQLYGDAGIAEMRAIKRAMDPEGKLAAGVLFP
ncbi:MAG: FAD-binding oxidoreductase [Acidobacteriota bacterium]|nr:FAD-binding oxidoreductase [Acidobacteriota bacterium]